MLDNPPRDAIADSSVDRSIRLALLGRHGIDTAQLVKIAKQDELNYINHCNTIWAELCWAAHAEGVVHLDDLLMRKIRIGLPLPEGGLPWLEKICAIVQSELGWDDSRWEQERVNYQRKYQSSYSLPI